MANAKLDEIEQLIAAGKARAAKPRIIQWIKANQAAPDRDRGLFLLSEMYNRTGDKIRAYYHLDELMDYYPESRLFYPALEKQFAIADRFLAGYKRRFLGIPFLTADDEGVEILFRIQERAPGSPIAERSLLRTADHYYDDVAVRPRRRRLRRLRAQLPAEPRGAARAAAAGVRVAGAVPRAAVRRHAGDRRQGAARGHPGGVPGAGRAGERRATCWSGSTGSWPRGCAQTADFYRRTNEPQAAAYNWRYLVENFPETGEADRAQAQLARLPAWRWSCRRRSAGAAPRRSSSARRPRTPPSRRRAARAAASRGGDPRPVHPPAAAAQGASDTDVAPSVETPSDDLNK